MQSLIKLLVLILASFRLTELITKDEGFKLRKEDDLGVFASFRRWSGKKAATTDSVFYQNLADIINCPFCAGIYISLLVLLLPAFVVYYIGIAGGQSLLESILNSKR